MKRISLALIFFTLPYLCHGQSTPDYHYQFKWLIKLIENDNTGLMDQTKSQIQYWEEKREDPFISPLYQDPHTHEKANYVKKKAYRLVNKKINRILKRYERDWRENSFDEQEALSPHENTSDQDDGLTLLEQSTETYKIKTSFSTSRAKLSLSSPYFLFKSLFQYTGEALFGFERDLKILGARAFLYYSVHEKVTEASLEKSLFENISARTTLLDHPNDNRLENRLEFFYSSSF